MNMVTEKDPCQIFLSVNQRDSRSLTKKKRNKNKLNENICPESDYPFLNFARIAY